MIKLLSIEYMKLRHTRYFKVLSILWVVAFLAIPFATSGLLDYLDTTVGAISEEIPILPSQLPIFDFVDIWQNLAYVYKCITILLSFIIIISVTNDLDYSIARQNVIDGMSKSEYLRSKIYFILAVSLIATLALFILGLVAGYSLSPVTDWEYVVRNIEFVGAYFLQVFSFLMFCFVIALLVKRAGFAIALIIFWVYIIEPVSSSIVTYNLGSSLLGDMFPVEASWNFIRMPIEKYFLRPVQEFVSFQDLSIGIGYIGIYLLSSWLLITRRDL
jgi:hypothetical protein